MTNLEGKLVLVTGGGSGIGRAVCRLLEREEARVASADINLAGAEETIAMLKNPRNHLAVHMDVSSKESVTKGIDTIRKVFGAPPSLLAHCAGILSICSVVDLQEHEFDHMINVNLKVTENDPRNHLAVHMDVSSKESVTKGIDTIRKVFGAPPSLLAHCAGILSICSVVDLQEHEFDHMINVNLKGTFLVMQGVAQALREAQIKHGSIVSVSSVAACTPQSTYGHYAAAKAGVVTLTKSFAKGLASEGIRVNTVLPGLTETPLASKDLMEELKRQNVPKTPLGRAGRPEEIAELIVFLLSDRSSYMTGAEVMIGGGYSM